MCQKREPFGALYLTQIVVVFVMRLLRIVSSLVNLTLSLVELLEDLPVGRGTVCSTTAGFGTFGPKGSTVDRSRSGRLSLDQGFDETGAVTGGGALRMGCCAWSVCGSMR